MTLPIKLYFSPGACCMSCHIALLETNTPFDLVYVGKNANQKTREAFLTINPLGAVPALELDGGKILTQNIAILEYIADQNPSAHLLATVGTYERADTIRWSSFVASDLHKSFTILFRLNSISSNQSAQKDIKQWALNAINQYLSLVNTHLAGKHFLSGKHFTIADCYFYTVYQWTKSVSIATDAYPEINRYSNEISKRPSVIAIREKEEQYR